MKSMLCILVLSAFLPTFAWVAQSGDKDLDVYLDRLNISAEKDRDGFSVKLGAQFNIEKTKVDILLQKVDHPADAYMVLKTAEITHREPDVIIKEYHSHKHRGWGSMAKRMGIKPGSEEFHALKKHEREKYWEEREENEHGHGGDDHGHEGHGHDGDQQGSQGNDHGSQGNDNGHSKHKKHD
jgi:hypothetical protein